MVGSGSIGVEVDLQQLAASADVFEVRYDPEKHPGLYLRFVEDDPLATLYRTGKYNISGANTEKKMMDVRERFLNFLSEMGILDSPEDVQFGIQNYVYTANLAQEIDLNALSLHLGLEQIEYEPEQFAALVYRPNNGECVMLIFSNGKVVLTGLTDKYIAEDEYSKLKMDLAAV